VINKKTLFFIAKIFFSGLSVAADNSFNIYTLVSDPKTFKSFINVQRIYVGILPQHGA
jgi:hypothetical protein